MLTLNVFTYVILEYFPMFCNIQNPIFTVTNTLTHKYTFRNIHSIIKTLFSIDLDLSLTPLLTDPYKLFLTTFQNNFKINLNNLRRN